MNSLVLLTAAAGGNLMSTVMLIVLMGVFLVIMIVPQKRREKKEKEMRDSLQIGDGVTTIGGIVGRVISIKDDTILVETGSDRTKIRFNKWAVQTVEKLDLGDSVKVASKDDKKEEKKEEKKD